MHRTFMLIYCLNIRVFCWRIVLVWDGVLVCSLCSDAHTGIQVEHAQSVYCLSSHFREEQAAVPCSQELWPGVWIVTRHMKCWRKKNKRDPNTPSDLFAVVSLHSLWLHLTVPASSYECYIAREKRKHLTAYTQENKSSHQPRGKIGKVMRQSRPASWARNSGRRWQRDSHEQWRHIRKFSNIWRPFNINKVTWRKG